MIISKGKLVASDTPENLERMLGQNNIVEIEARTTTAEVRRILKNVPGIETIEAQSTGNGITKGSICEKKGADIRESVFRAFASAGQPLLTLKTSGTSLEDVFMELTQKETLPAAFAKNTGWEEVVPEEAETASAGADAVSAEADAEEVETSEADVQEMTAGKGEEQDAGNL